MRRLSRPLLVLLAIAFLVEAWLWSHLGPAIEWVVDRLPLRRLKAWIADVFRNLPPAAALVVFLVPVAAVLPFKLFGFWLLATKHWMAATGVLLAAKLFGLAITAFVFEVTRPNLLKIGWFRRLYERVLMALAWAHRLADPVTHRIKNFLRILRPKHAGRAWRLFWRVRSRMRGGGSFSAGAERAARTAQAP
jgi:hypothetical protein